MNSSFDFLRITCQNNKQQRLS